MKLIAARLCALSTEIRRQNATKMRCEDVILLGFVIATFPDPLSLKSL